MVRAAITDENQAFFDEAQQCGHLAGDVHHWLTRIHPDANVLLDDAYSRFLGIRDGRTHWARLTDLGIHLEDAYVAWRSNAPLQPAAALGALESAARNFGEMVSTYAGTIADEGMDRVDAAAMAAVDRRFESARAMQIVGRALDRAAMDFAGWPDADIRAVAEEARRIRREERLAFLPVIRLGGGEDVDEHYDGDYGSAAVRRTRSRIRKSMQERRRAVVRSSRLLSRLVGHDATRMFVGGTGLRIEGRHAIYEMRKESPLDHSYGGYQALWVFDRENPDMLLCKICIQTDGVPLLDHIASLVLHIQAGMEEEILRIGNAMAVTDAAYRQDWLQPFIPTRPDWEFGIGRADRPRPAVGAFVAHPERIPGLDARPGLQERHERADRLRPAVARHLFAAAYRGHVPLLRCANPDFGRMGTRTVNLAELAQDIGVWEVPPDREAVGISDELVQALMAA